MTTAPVGALVGLFYDGLVARDEYLITPTGRTYLVVSARVQRRGTHRGRRHLRCLVVAEPPPGVRTRPDRKSVV